MKQFLSPIALATAIVLGFITLLAVANGVRAEQACLGLPLSEGRAAMEAQGARFSPVPEAVRIVAERNWNAVEPKTDDHMDALMVMLLDGRAGLLLYTGECVVGMFPVGSPQLRSLLDETGA